MRRDYPKTAIGYIDNIVWTLMLLTYVSKSVVLQTDHRSLKNNTWCWKEIISGYPSCWNNVRK